MPSKLPPHFVDLVQDALLKSFWTKKALKRFLRRSHVSERFLSQLDPNEYKRDWLDLLFPKLEATDRGLALIQQMALALAEQVTFPDLENWEDSDKKIESAKASVAQLKAYLDKKSSDEESLRNQERIKETAREQQRAFLASKASLESLTDQLDQLGLRLGEQSAGYDFQEWFYALMDFSEIPNRKPYTDPHRRQIDGSITLEGTTYIVELKFKSARTPPQDVSDLRDKVRTKADNTMAILVSISGFTDAAKLAASGDGTPLLILDASHLYCCLTGALSFSEIISRLRRHSSQTGEAYLPPDRFGG